MKNLIGEERTVVRGAGGYTPAEDDSDFEWTGLKNLQVSFFAVVRKNGRFCVKMGGFRLVNMSG